jgi:hypothetical protein
MPERSCAQLDRRPVRERRDRCRGTRGGRRAQSPRSRASSLMARASCAGSRRRASSLIRSSWRRAWRSTESCRPSTIASSASTRWISERRSGGSGRDRRLARSLRARSRCRTAPQPRFRVFPVAERRPGRVIAVSSAALRRRSAASRLSRRWVSMNPAPRSAGDADLCVGRGTARCGGVTASSSRSLIGIDRAQGEERFARARQRRTQRLAGRFSR